jgi:hypothetical protein
MNTQLKKGDKCQTKQGIVIYDHRQADNWHCCRMEKNGDILYFRLTQLTRIPSHAERMQVILDIAWDVENRLDDNETVQLKVGEFVEFARHYYDLQQELLECVNYYKSNAKSSIDVAESIEKLMKGETS